MSKSAPLAAAREILNALWYPGSFTCEADRAHKFELKVKEVAAIIDAHADPQTRGESDA
jgi:predicted outer membrane lipoprotein